MQRGTPEFIARETARKAAARARRREIFGTCEPNRMPGAHPIPRACPDPEDYAHPLADVVVGP